jgi:superoxide reductase
MASEALQIYKCSGCGIVVEVLDAGAGTLNCCGKPMDLLAENSTDAAQEKHVPVVEQVDGGTKVTVGSVAHPMTDEHLIQWVELLLAGKTYRQTLKAGDAPEVLFPVKGDGAVARAYCNIHGLWKA